MRHLILMTAASLLLAACGGDEPAQTVTEEPAATLEEQPTADEASAPGTETEEAADEALQVVEESAAETEPDEQPILLASTGPAPAPIDYKFSEGKHYVRLVPTQPTVGGADKIEVAEFFWYGCPHCYDFEPYINRWNESKPASVRFVRIPAMWNGVLRMHAQLYYTEEVLVRNGVIKDGAAFRDTVFREYQGGNRLMSEGSIQRLFERFGVSSDEFIRTWGSFEVAQKMRVAEDLARRYSISNVPTMVVNGKYRTGGGEAGGFQGMIDVVDELVVRESVR